MNPGLVLAAAADDDGIDWVVVVPPILSSVLALLVVWLGHIFTRKQSDTAWKRQQAQAEEDWRRQREEAETTFERQRASWNEQADEERRKLRSEEYRTFLRDLALAVNVARVSVLEFDQRADLEGSHVLRVEAASKWNVAQVRFNETMAIAKVMLDEKDRHEIVGVCMVYQSACYELVDTPREVSARHAALSVLNQEFDRSLNVIRDAVQRSYKR